MGKALRFHEEERSPGRVAHTRAERGEEGDPVIDPRCPAGLTVKGRLPELGSSVDAIQEPDAIPIRCPAGKFRMADIKDVLDMKPVIGHWCLHPLVICHRRVA
jgi:hypothetical protein